MKLKVKVVPGSSRDFVVGWLGDALKIKTKTQPENGKANIAVKKLLAKALDLPARNIEITSGLTQGNKVIEIIGFDSKEEISVQLSI